MFNSGQTLARKNRRHLTSLVEKDIFPPHLRDDGLGIMLMISEMDCVDPSCPTPTDGMETVVVIVFPRDYDREAAVLAAAPVASALPSLFPDDDSDDDSGDDREGGSGAIPEGPGRDATLAALPIPESYSYRCVPVPMPMAEVTLPDLKKVLPVWLGGKYEEPDDDGGSADDEISTAEAKTAGPEKSENSGVVEAATVPKTGNFVFKRGVVAGTAATSKARLVTKASGSGVAWRQRQKMNGLLRSDRFCEFNSSRKDPIGGTRPRGCPCCDPDNPSNILDMNLMI
eukprot:CAMPEP_0194274146 /NCGR_PEP_ID=MMETSP0169-20130528/7303_1 /TAXON_ID=218684 /ORGANISM="Corethron pennatum, Strain L29A3" /LENGTH=284 /DNA_ID=CAMNT_0039017267 /DNA_START=75 /DNA_END=929 /DNA_ORIENTATION=-